MSTTVTYKGSVIAAVNNNTKTLKTAGTYMEDDITLSDSSGGGSGPAVEKQVNFIDYDGTILYSYTAEEANALTALPANPFHDGLMAQGWNWTLLQIKAQLTAFPDKQVWVGQMYVTDDDKTRIYCRFEKGRLSPYLGICPNGTVTVDWGDDSATDTLTGSSLTVVQTVQHTYAAAGDYVITLTAASGTTFAFYGSSTYYAYILRRGTESTVSKTQSAIYRNAIYKIELGSAARIENYAFYYCNGLRSITIPSSLTSIGTYAFYYCTSLYSITIPSDVTSIGTYTFYYCYALCSITIPSGVTSIGDRAFYYCYSLYSITIPSGVTSIGSYALYYCYNLISPYIPNNLTSISTYSFYALWRLSSITIPSGITSIGANAFAYNHCTKEYHLKSTTPPTLSNTNAFSSIPSDCVIYVPSSENHTVLNTYKTTSNWSTYADYMQEEPS